MVSSRLCLSWRKLPRLPRIESVSFHGISFVHVRLGCLRKSTERACRIRCKQLHRAALPLCRELVTFPRTVPALVLAVQSLRVKEDTGGIAKGNAMLCDVFARPFPRPIQRSLSIGTTYELHTLGKCDESLMLVETAGPDRGEKRSGPSRRSSSVLIAREGQHQTAEVKPIATSGAPPHSSATPRTWDPHPVV